MREYADVPMPTQSSKTKTKAAPAARKGAAAKARADKPATAAKPRAAKTATGPDLDALERATRELAREREAVERAVAELRALRVSPPPRAALPSYRRPIRWNEAALFGAGIGVLVLLIVTVALS